jgi:hypothetical protein
VTADGSFAKRKRKASSASCFDDNSDEETPVAVVTNDDSDEDYVGMATYIDDGLEPTMSRRGHDSKRSKASGNKKEMMKSKSTDKNTKAGEVVDLTDEHLTVVDLTDEHLTEEDFDKPMEKIRRELARRKAGLSSKKPASEDKEKIEEEMKKRHETSSQYSVHRYVFSDPGKIGLKQALLPRSKILKVSTVHTDSIASRHGIEVEDEILWPSITLGPDPETDGRTVFDLFIAAAKKKGIIADATKRRQSMMFEIQRTYQHDMHNTKMIDGQLHCLHRFIVTEKGELGITLETHQSTARLREVSKNSLAEYFGMRKNDIIVSERPLELPEDVNMYYDEINTGERPTVIEVWRATTSERNRTLTSINIQVDRDNPFLIEFPKMKEKQKVNELVKGSGKNRGMIESANDEVEIETKRKGETRRGKKDKLDSSKVVMGDRDDREEPRGGNSGDNSLEEVTIMVKGTSGIRERRTARIGDLFNAARSNITFVKDRITYSCGPPKTITKNRRTTQYEKVYKCCMVYSKKKKMWENNPKHRNKSNSAVVGCTGMIKGYFRNDTYWFITKNCHTCDRGRGGINTGVSREDYRPKIQIISPAPMWNITQASKEKITQVLQACPDSWWENLPGQGSGRRWLKGINEVGKWNGEAVKQQIEAMMRPYLEFIKYQYPCLKYWRVGALQTKPNTPSQYEKLQNQLHSDYSESALEREPGERPMSMIMALDEFAFLYEDKDTNDGDDNVDEDDICEMTVRSGHAIAFTNELFHAGGANLTGKTIYRLFAYIVSDEKDYPNSKVFTKNRSNMNKLNAARERLRSRKTKG